MRSRGGAVRERYFGGHTLKRAHRAFTGKMLAVPLRPLVRRGRSIEPASRRTESPHSFRAWESRYKAIRRASMSRVVPFFVALAMLACVASIPCRGADPVHHDGQAKVGDKLNTKGVHHIDSVADHKVH